MLRDVPDQTVAWGLGEFRRLLEDVGRGLGGDLPESVIGPEFWFSVVAKYEEFLAVHPEHAAADAEDIAASEFVRAMAAGRRDLLNYAEAIRMELADFQTQTRPTVFSRLLDEVWDPATQQIMREWSRQGGDYTDESIRALEWDMAIRNAYLRSWLGLAFNRVIGRSDIVHEIVVEEAIRLPDRETDWPKFPRPTLVDGDQRVVARDAGFVEIDYELRERRQLWEDALRSQQMQDVVLHGFGHALLTGTRFDILCDVSERDERGFASDPQACR